MLAVISFIRPNSSCAALRYRLGRASPRKHSSNKNSALPKAWSGFLSSWATAAIKRPLAAKSSVRAALPDCRRADEVRVNKPTSSRYGLTQKDCLSGSVSSSPGPAIQCLGCPGVQDTCKCTKTDVLQKG